MAGQLWIWGSNGYGSLGDNTSVTGRSSPIQTIAEGTNWKLLTSTQNGYGGSNTFGIKTDGTLWCWGRNYFGSLGDNTSISRSSPVQIFGEGNWTAISAGYHTAGIKSDGTLWIWGRNNVGQLGDNTLVDKSSPVQTVTAGNNWRLVSCGSNHTAAIKTDGTLWVWGNNYQSQLGDNTTVSKSSPIQTITGGNSWVQVSCGTTHTAAIKTDGTLWTWGLNSEGQLGINTTTHRSSPVQTVAGGNSWAQVSCGSNYTAAIKTDGTLWTWGFNSDGQLGINTTTNRSSPVQTIAFGTNWSSVSNKLLHTVATKTDGTLWSWGRNSYGQIGDNTTTNRSSPVQTVMTGIRWSFVANAYTTAAIYENTPTALSIATQPANAYTGQKLLNQPVINVVDSSGAIVLAPPIAVTVLLASGSPTLTGTTNLLSSGGVVSYSDLALTGIGSGSLIFIASGLTSAISNYVAVEQSSIAIVPKRTETSGRIPDATQLRNGELAINIADKKGYVKNSSGAIVNVFTGLGDSTITSGMVAENAINTREIAPGAVGSSELASGVIGGSSSQILYNSSGTIAGTAALTLSTTSGVVTIAPQNAGYNALTLRSFTSQTADLLKVQNSAGTDIARITSSGEWVGPLGSGNIVSGYIASGQIGAFHLASGVGGSSTAAGASGMLQYNIGGAFGPTSGLRYSVTSGTPLVQATSQTAFNVNLAIKASSGQVSNLTQWQNTSGSALAYMDASGNFFAVSKSFLIDHPTKPGKKLRHVSLEGPTADVFVRGKTKEKVINLPEYWIGLVDYENITVILTPIGKDQTLYVDKIEGNKVYIDGNAFPNYHYIIIAERTDIEKVVVEE